MPLDGSSNLFQMEVWLWDMYVRQTFAMSRTFFGSMHSEISLMWLSMLLVVVVQSYSFLNTVGRMVYLFQKANFPLHWHSLACLWLFLLKEG